MSKGSDRRPIHDAKDRELTYASLIFQAMTQDTSREGLAFNAEMAQLSRRWERLVRSLMTSGVRGWGGPPSELGVIERYLEQASVGRPVFYPKPRELSPTEQARLECRQDVVNQALEQLHQELQSHCKGRDEQTRVWLEACTFLHQWIDEVRHEANPGRKLRVSTHPMVKKYPKEVASFCKRWHLDAWWAVPAIIQSHFLQPKIGRHPPLSMFLAGEVGPVDTYTVIARLPGVRDDEYECDSARFGDIMLNQADTSTSQPIDIRWRPHRGEMRELESQYEAACVVVDWDGRHHYPSRNDPPRQLTPSEHIIEECQIRMGRQLKKSEKRDILRQITPQIEDGRQWFLDKRWYTPGHADLNTHAKWIAQRLLDPSVSWEKITGVDADQLPSVMRSCYTFAERAKLGLPGRHTKGVKATL